MRQSWLSKVALNLIPITNMEIASSPNGTDIEMHLALLEGFMIAFPKKVPAELICLKGLCGLDQFYRMKLSKTDNLKKQKAWSITDAVALRL